MYELPELLLCQFVVPDTQPLTVKDCLTFLIAPLETHYFLNVLFQCLCNGLDQDCIAVIFVGGTNVTNQPD